MKPLSKDQAQAKIDRLKTRISKLEAEFYRYFPGGMESGHIYRKAYEGEFKRLTQKMMAIKDFVSGQRGLPFK